MPRVEPCETIDQVVDHLTEIVETSKRDGSRAGYFAALYRKVTIEVRDRIRAGDTFDDDARMERLDVLFAERYIEAYERTRSGQGTTACASRAVKLPDSATQIATAVP